MSEKTLWYIADPLCSWCWGFSPVIESIRLDYFEQLQVKLVLGGLRTGTKETITPKERNRILHHWQAVRCLTDQKFQFEGAMPEGFIYDTEPTSRGLIAASLIKPEIIFPFLKAIQSAFYTELKDVTKFDVLAQLAVNMGVSAEKFLEVYESSEAKIQTRAHFNRVHRWGVNTFPSLVAQDASSHRVLTRGYCSSEELRLRIDNWLEI